MERTRFPVLRARHHLRLGFSPPERVFTLQCGDGLNGVGAADRLHSCFRKAEVLDLAWLNQFLHRACDFFDRHVRIDPMLI